MTPSQSKLYQQAERLEDALRTLQRVVIAFSGGVDSSVVAAAAHRANLEAAIAVTADSPSVAAWQLEIAKQVAVEIGIEHQVVATDEVDRPEYRVNSQSRCYFCKETLYESLRQVSLSFPNATIVSGTNADDLGDHRPGIDAGRQAGVVTPLADLGIGKAKVRQLAAHYGLSNRSLPASPCLASRIAYGTEVTPQRLKQVEQAEEYLRALGFDQCRVRVHPDDLARIEVPLVQIANLIEASQGSNLTAFFNEVGFKFVSVDLAGFQTGSMNRVLVNIGHQSDRKEQHEQGADRDAADRNQEALG